MLVKESRPDQLTQIAARNNGTMIVESRVRYHGGGPAAALGGTNGRETEDGQTFSMTGSVLRAVMILSK